MQQTPPHRAAGLDTLRACAIALVFMYHYMVFVSREATFGWASVVGWAGVDLFFVLSGYLIANQLFAGMAQGQRLSLAAFYMRRGLRTWPAFWVVLAAFFMFPGELGGRTPPPLWTFLTFTQNIGLKSGTAFSHAWSLCIEEQFYLVLPLALIAAAQIGNRRWQAWLFLALLVAAGMTTRAILWQDHGREVAGQASGYMSHIYYSTLCRFDEFIPGVAVALLRHAHPLLWKRLMGHGQLLLAVAACAVMAMLYGAYTAYYIDGYGYGAFMTIFGYSLLAMSFALLVAAALSPRSLLHQLRVPGAYWLALWSYSIYLIHKPVGHIINKAGMSPSATVVTAIVVSVAGGALLYYLVEKPFMWLRDRWLPSNFGAASPAGTRIAVTATPP
jgi:peptidoglycan/LPS O-acetylase OafA/YrhL